MRLTQTRPHLREAVQEVGPELLFPRDHAGEFPDVRAALGVVDGAEKFVGTLHEEERALVVDVGDEEAGEKEAVALAGGVERGESAGRCRSRPASSAPRSARR